MQEFFVRNPIMSSAAAEDKTLHYQDRYLNFSTCFMKNVLFEQKMIKTGNK
jgi:hypothetical protein